MENVNFPLSLNSDGSWINKNNPAPITREDRDIRAFALAGAIYDAAHDRNHRDQPD